MAWLSMVALGLLLLVAAAENVYARRTRRSPDQSEGALAWKGLRLLQLRALRYVLIACVVAPGIRDGGALAIVSASLVVLAMLAALGWAGLLARLRLKGQWPVRPTG